MWAEDEWEGRTDRDTRLHLHLFSQKNSEVISRHLRLSACKKWMQLIMRRSGLVQAVSNSERFHTLIS